MKIVAGVILIIAAVFNLFAAFGYMAGGAASTGLSTAVKEVVKELAKEDETLDTQLTEEAQEGHFRMQAYGSAFLAFGIILLVSVGILIAGAVFLFMGKKPGFIMVAGGVAILAEVAGILITTTGVTNLVGIVGGALALFAAKQMSGAAGTA